MSQVKRCCFKNCTTKHGDIHYTLFSFPKTANRIKEWDEIAECSHIPENKKFLCEKHFSPIYIAANPRRKLLLNTAVPNRITQRSIYESEKYNTNNMPAIEQTVDMENYILYKSPAVDLNTFLIQQSSIQEIGPHQSTDTSVSYNQIGDNGTNITFSTIYTDSDNPVVVSSAEEDVGLLQISKSDDGLNGESSRFESLAISLLLPKEDDEALEDIEEICADDNDGVLVAGPIENIKIEDNSIDSLVTSSIVNGIEYIHMPKSVYLEEKQRLETELNFYKTIVKNFKKQLDHV